MNALTRKWLPTLHCAQFHLLKMYVFCFQSNNMKICCQLLIEFSIQTELEHFSPGTMVDESLYSDAGFGCGGW
jgi:hypothetical protein